MFEYRIYCFSLKCNKEQPCDDMIALYLKIDFILTKDRVLRIVSDPASINYFIV